MVQMPEFLDNLDEMVEGDVQIGKFKIPKIALIGGVVVVGGVVFVITRNKGNGGGGSLMGSGVPDPNTPSEQLAGENAAIQDGQLGNIQSSLDQQIADTASELSNSFAEQINSVYEAISGIQTYDSPIGIEDYYQDMPVSSYDIPYSYDIMSNYGEPDYGYNQGFEIPTTNVLTPNSKGVRYTGQETLKQKLAQNKPNLIASLSPTKTKPKPPVNDNLPNVVNFNKQPVSISTPVKKQNLVSSLIGSISSNFNKIPSAISPSKPPPTMNFKPSAPPAPKPVIASIPKVQNFASSFKSSNNYKQPPKPQPVFTPPKVAIAPNKKVTGSGKLKAD